MKSRSSLFVLALLFLLGTGAYVLYPGLATSEPDAAPTPRAGSAMLLPGARVRAAANRLTEFNLIANSPIVPSIEMRDVDGKPVVFDRFRGKVVLFNLWATWCPPCIREMPDLNALQAQYRDRGLVVVPVASGMQGKEEPTEFLRKYGLDELTTYYDLNSYFLRVFDLETLPITFVIDRNGIMRGGVLGIMDWRSAEARALIEAFLDEHQM